MVGVRETENEGMGVIGERQKKEKEGWRRKEARGNGRATGSLSKKK